MCGHPSVRPTWECLRADRPLPVRPCSGWGLPSHPGRPGRWCALTAPFHPHLCTAPPRCRGHAVPSAVCSLWHFPAGRPDWQLASILSSGAPTFLSVADHAAATRPAHRRHQCGATGPRHPPRSHRSAICPPAGAGTREDGVIRGTRKGLRRRTGGTSTSGEMGLAAQTETATAVWHLNGACRGLDASIFYHDSEDEQQANRAKAVCVGCDVREVCLEHALTWRENTGVWGGATERERRRILRRRRRTA